MTETKFMFDTPPTLEEVQDFLGGYAEMLEAKFFNTTVQVLINEEGKIHKLPENHRASNLVGFDIVGNVMVLAGSARWLE